MNLKKMLFGAGLVLMVAVSLMSPPVARASIGTQDFGITNTLAPAIATTANMGSTNGYKVADQDNVGFQFSCQGDNTSTSTITLTFQRSALGISWETPAPITWAVALNNNTAVVYYTNFPNTVIGACGYIRLLSITNASGTVNATNCSLKMIKKNLPRG